MNLYWIWLNELDGIGPVLSKRLLKAFGNPENIYRSSIKELQGIEGIGKNIAEKIYNNKATDKAKKILEKCYKGNINILTLNDNFYEDCFKYKYSPILYYYKGKLNKNDKLISIIGTRSCSKYGKDITRDIVKQLIQDKSTIISGSSKGIEAIAHTETVKNGGKAMVFLPCGIDCIYPKEHEKLIQAILNIGVAISQYSPGEKVKKNHLIQKNRRMMEWSDEVIITEAPINSSSLSTVEYAKDINKIVHAVPHNLYSKEGAGTNKLIHEGKASMFFFKERSRKEEIETEDRINFSSIQQEILEFLKFKEYYIEELKQKLDLDESVLLTELFSLEMSGRVKIKGGLVSMY